MSRYYVLITPTAPDLSYILAEVVRERGQPGIHREDSIAGGLAGPSASIITSEELAETEAGREALRRWGAGDDAEFDGSTIDDATSGEGGTPALRVRYLHLISEDDS